jgi:hypothetical protein
MKLKTLPAIMLAAIVVSLSSCDDTPTSPAPDFGIVSTETFKVLETYENGWIKRAEQYNTNNKILREFSYYQNGYLERYKLYRERLQNHQAVTTLYLEHERTEADQPIRSKYYDVNGNLFAELLYSDGLLASKVIHYKDTKTTWLYQQGSIQSVEKADSQTGETALVTYDYSANKRFIKISVPGKSERIVEAPLRRDLGTGFNATDDILLLNILGENSEFSVTTINHSSWTSLSRETAVDVNELGFAPIEYYDLENDFVAKFGSLNEAYAMKNLLNSNFNRSWMEQYPFTEGTVLIAKSRSIESQYRLKDNLLDDVIASTKNLRAMYAEDFERLYGDGYVTKFHTGKTLFIIGTIRNLPSDPTLRGQVLDAAEKYANDLMNDQNTVTQEEKNLLSRVFFQLKAHSNLLEANGRILKSYADYNDVVDMIDTADAVSVNFVLVEHF